MEYEKKEKYEKPVLVSIELKAEEVLGGGCNKPLTPAIHLPTCDGGACVGLGTS